MALPRFLLPLAARVAMRRPAALLCLALALGGAACERGRADSDARVQGVPLTIGLTSVSVDVRPLARMLTTLSLVGTGPDGRATPGLLEQWTTSPDGLTWTFALRPDVDKHDGTRVTAADVVALIQEQMEYDPPPGLLDVEKLEAVDNVTLRVHLRAPSSLLLEALTLTRAVKAGPFLPNTAEIPETSSPVLLGRPQPDGTPPTVSRVIFRRYDSPRSAWAALMRDEIDLLHEVSGDARPFLEQEPGIEVRPFLRPFIVTLGLNVRHPALRSRKARLALNLAVDRTEVLARDLGGFGEIATGPVSPRHWASDSAVQPYDYDPVLARRLLDEAGLPMRDGGDRGPSRVQLTCLVLDDQPRFERVALRVQRALAAVGVDLRLEALPLAELFARLQAGRFDTYLTTVLSGHGPSALYQMWGRDYRGVYVDHGYVAAEPALEALRRAHVPETFVRDLRQVQRVLIDDPPAVFIAWDEGARAVGRRFVVPPGLGRDILSTLSRWQPRPLPAGSSS